MPARAPEAADGLAVDGDHGVSQGANLENGAGRRGTQAEATLKHRREGSFETSAAVCSSPFEEHDAMSPTASSVLEVGVVAPAPPVRASAQARASSARLGRSDTRDLDRFQRRSFPQVVAGEEERESIRRALVPANPADEHLVASGGVLRRRELR